jgi:hypothetical protein
LHAAIFLNVSFGSFSPSMSALRKPTLAPGKTQGERTLAYG